jgi:hypothetical protein
MSVKILVYTDFAPEPIVFTCDGKYILYILGEKSRDKT